MREQGVHAASIPNVHGPVVEAPRIHPRLAPRGFDEEDRAQGGYGCAERARLNGSIVPPPGPGGGAFDD